MDLGDRKRRLREAMAARRRRVGDSEARGAGEAVWTQLAATPEVRDCLRIALYAALPDELPTAALVPRLRSLGKTLLWPRLAPDRRLEFAECARAEELVPGPFGVPAPRASVAPTQPRRGDTVLVPGLAFDAAGRRLGRGGGHYDRAFPPGADQAPFLIGVAYEFQLVSRVPAGPRVRAMDAIVTEVRYRLAR